MITALLGVVDWLVNSKIGRWLMIAGAAFLALLGLRAKWRSEGAAKERQEAQAKDRSNADQIRDRVDAADDGSVREPSDRIFRD